MNRTFIISMLVVIISVALITNGSANSYKKISFIEMRKLKTDSSVIVDVRTKEEYKTGHVPGSILIPDYEIDKISSYVKDKNIIIFVYCRSGNRSKIASEKLIGMGYKNVYDVGGIIDYPYELEY